LLIHEPIITIIKNIAGVDAGLMYEIGGAARGVVGILLEGMEGIRVRVRRSVAGARIVIIQRDTSTGEGG